MLSRLAQQFADEIRLQDWSDAPYRADRAGHNREFDTNRNAGFLEPTQTDVVRLNVMWVTAQVLAYNDPNFDVVEYAAACGCASISKGILKAGLRGAGSEYQRPGTYEFDEEVDALPSS